MIPDMPPELQPLTRYRHRHNYGKWAQRGIVLARKRKDNRKKNKITRQARRKNKS